MDQKVSKFKDIFSGLERAHGVFQPNGKVKENGKREGDAWINKKPVEDSLWGRHLEGDWPSLGIIPINEKNECRWVAIDVDEYPIDHANIVKTLKEKNLPFITAISKSGGAHLFLFFKEPISSEIAHNKIKDLASRLGYGGCETFPKQPSLGKEATGNFLNLPYHNGLNFSDRYAFSEQGNALSLDEFLEEVDKKSLTLEEFQNLSLAPKKQVKSPFSDAPFCIEAYLDENKKVQQGSRDNMLFHYSVFAKKKYGESFAEEVQKFHHNYFEEPLAPAQIEKVIRQVEKKDWGYKCNDQPMCAFCNKSKCRVRKYGIGETNEVSDIDNVFQYGEGLDSFYEMTVNGEHKLVVGVQELYEQSKFRMHCLAKISMMPPNMRRSDWDQFILSIVSKAVKVKEFEMSPVGRLKNYLTKFIVNQGNALSMDDIVNGSCFTSEEEGRVFFRLDQFQEYMRNKRLPAIDENKLGIYLREIGGSSTKRKLNGKPGLLVWYVASKDFTNRIEQIDEAEIERTELEPF